MPIVKPPVVVAHTPPAPVVASVVSPVPSPVVLVRSGPQQPLVDPVAFLARFIVGFIIGAGTVLGMIFVLPLLLMAVVFILGLVGFAAVLCFVAGMFSSDRTPEAHVRTKVRL